MTKVLIFSDIHNDLPALQRLLAIDADAYFCAGDLVNWGRGLDRMAPLLKPKGERMYMLPGNHESERDIADFRSKARLCELSWRDEGVRRPALRWFGS